MNIWVWSLIVAFHAELVGFSGPSQECWCSFEGRWAHWGRLAHRGRWTSFLRVCVEWRYIRWLRSLRWRNSGSMNTEFLRLGHWVLLWAYAYSRSRSSRRTSTLDSKSPAFWPESLAWFPFSSHRVDSPVWYTLAMAFLNHPYLKALIDCHSLQSWLTSLIYWACFIWNKQPMPVRYYLDWVCSSLYQ